MRTLWITATAALALSACGGNQSEQANDANMTAADNMMLDENAAMTGGNMDANMMNADPATQNAMMNDMTHNDADTNLANGM